MTENTNAESFRGAVSAAISSIQHLYREVDRLRVGPRDALAEGESPLTPIRGTMVSSSSRAARTIVWNEYGILFGPADDEEEPDDEDPDEEGDEEEEGAERPRKRGPVEFSSDQLLLAVRIPMYDPQKQGAAEPRVEFAVLGDWSVADVPADKAGRYLLPSYQVRRIPRALGQAHGLARGARLATRAGVRRLDGGKKRTGRLTCRLVVPVASESLYSLDSFEALQALANRMKQAWNEANQRTPAR